MTLYEKIIEAYPELISDDFGHRSFIVLRDDSDGTGEYIEKWEYSKPLTTALKKYLKK
jgi:hypothetical protein